MNKKNIFFGVVTALFTALFLNACNLYGFIDKPTTEDQLLSAARSCLDDGDWECAQNYYVQLRGGTYSDWAWAEDSFAILEHYGISVGQFAKAFAASADGTGLNRFANLAVAGAGTSARLGIFGAYAAVASNQIKNIEIRGLTRMIVATALAATILAEAARTDGVLMRADLAENPTQCLTISTPACASNTSCLPSSAGLVATGTALDLDTATATQFSGQASLFMLDAALQEVKVGLTELGALGGRFGSGIGNLVSGLSTALITLGQGGCYNKQLLLNGVGGGS